MYFCRKKGRGKRRPWGNFEILSTDDFTCHISTTESKSKKVARSTFDRFNFMTNGKKITQIGHCNLKLCANLVFQKPVLGSPSSAV